LLLIAMVELFSPEMASEQTGARRVGAGLGLA
jgi:hypothetical protein